MHYKNVKLLFFFLAEGDCIDEGQRLLFGITFTSNESFRGIFKEKVYVINCVWHWNLYL